LSEKRRGGGQILGVKNLIELEMKWNDRFKKKATSEAERAVGTHTQELWRGEQRLSIDKRSDPETLRCKKAAPRKKRGEKSRVVRELGEKRGDL